MRTNGNEVRKAIEGSRNYWKRRAETAEAENLRVRGLLQRQSDALCGMIATFESGDHADKSSEFGICSTGMCAICDAQEALDAVHDANSETTVSPATAQSPANTRLVRPADKSVEYSSQNPNFPQSSSGAESADIGKLDTADKKGKVVWIAKCTTGHCRWMEMCKHVQNEENAIHRLAKHSELHMDGATGRVYSLTLAEGVKM